MRIFSLLGLVIAMAVGAYIYSRQVKTMAAVSPGAATADVANVVGVKNDLISIANAERGYMATEGKYGSLDDLISGNYINIRSGRPPYVYDIELGTGTFRATATRSTPGSPSQISITETMQIESSD